MQVFRELESLRRWRDSADAPVTLVPTMGNLHAGHLALIEHARMRGGSVIASIFVNPAQFGPGEDYQRYPRTPDEDIERLAAAGCEAIWMPEVAGMYPAGPDSGFGVCVPGRLADCLCGAQRPGHFDGVANAVMRLFWQVRPERAVFGEKDWQQLVILRALVREFSIPVTIDSVPTVREADGLAMSSRNRYLDENQCARAPELYRTLCQAARQAAASTAPGTLKDVGRSSLMRLKAAGFEPEYLEFRDQDTLAPAAGRADRVFAAAWLGSARLIDNVVILRQSCR